MVSWHRPACAYGKGSMIVRKLCFLLVLCSLAAGGVGLAYGEVESPFGEDSTESPEAAAAREAKINKLLIDLENPDERTRLDAGIELRKAGRRADVPLLAKSLMSGGN